MFSYTLLKRSERSRARLGVISTPHGEIETPAFIPVATRATIRTLDSDEVAELGSQALICNTYHLHLAPGEDLVQKHGGIHGFMKWDRPLMTDSGGFQVYSLGFGMDHSMGKILKEPTDEKLEEGAAPVNVKITETGVHFRSPIDGTQLYLDPKVSIGIQEKLGADIMFAFDECPSPLADESYMRRSMEKTHRWAQECIDAKTTDQALYGIVQGGSFKALREESARTIGAMDFQGFGIGGEFGYDKPTMRDVVGMVTDLLPHEKPRHLLGVGHPEDFSYIAESGCDTFDCIAPTHYARRGVLFASDGRVDLRKPTTMQMDGPLDPGCSCAVCSSYSRAYVSHLLRAKELSGMKLATYHNLYHLNELAKKIRIAIGNGEL